jgi:Integron cassette protein
MNAFQASFEVFSPRWGHEDRYEIVLKRDEFPVARGPSVAKCKHVDGRDPEWSGYGGPGGNPLMNMFSNDSIHAPAIVPFALEWAWRQWRDGAVLEDDLRSSLRELFEWIDRTARASPKGAFWQRAF